MYRAAHSSRTALTFLAVATALMGSPKDPFRVREGSTLAFDGTSTLRDWTCTADRFSATVDSDPETAESILAGRKVTTTVLAEFPVANLECKNGTMNAHMRKALNATQHPVIAFTLSAYDLAGVRDGSREVPGTLQGTLRMNGQTHPITVPVRFSGAGDDALRVTGKVPLNMRQWGVVPPTLMLGTLKVGESVTVRFDLVLAP